MSHRKNNTAKLLTLAITITLLGSLPVMAQDASVKEFGSGYGTGDELPQLVSSRPILGQPVTLAAAGLAPEGFAWFFFSLVPDKSTAIDQHRTIYFDLKHYAAVGGYLVEQDGFLVVPSTLPKVPELMGVEIVVQAASVAPKGGLDVTNGLLWRIGQ